MFTKNWQSILFVFCRADSRLVPSQWETTLLCNDVSHWLGANLDSALCSVCTKLIILVLFYVYKRVSILFNFVLCVGKTGHLFLLYVYERLTISEIWLKVMLMQLTRCLTMGIGCCVNSTPDLCNLGNDFTLYALNMVFYPCGNYWDYFPGTLSFNQVTPNHLKIGHP